MCTSFYHFFCLYCCYLKTFSPLEFTFVSWMLHGIRVTKMYFGIESWNNIHIENIQQWLIMANKYRRLKSIPAL